MKSTNPALGLAAVAALAALVVPVHAQDYPARPIRIVLPFSPGGGTDLLARLLSKRFYEVFGQTATVDNRPGAGGNLGADIVAKSAPDGYTLLMSTASLAVNVTLYSKLPYRSAPRFHSDHPGGVGAARGHRASIGARAQRERIRRTRQKNAQRA